VAAALFEQTQLVDPAIFLLLIADVFPYRFFVPTDGGNMVATSPKMLSGEVAPMPQIITGYVNRTFALDEPNNLGHRILWGY